MNTYNTQQDIDNGPNLTYYTNAILYFVFVMVVLLSSQGALKNRRGLLRILFAKHDCRYRSVGGRESTVQR